MNLPDLEVNTLIIINKLYPFFTINFVIDNRITIFATILKK